MWQLIFELIEAVLIIVYRVRRIMGLREPQRDNYPLCKVCGGGWHGLPDSQGCPGAFATPDQEDAYWYARTNGLPTGERKVYADD